MYRPAAIVLLGLLLGSVTACSEAPRAVPATTSTASLTSSAGTAAPYLYIASKAPSFQSAKHGMTTVFQVGRQTPLKIATDTVHPTDVAVDHDGNVYVISEGSLYVYTPGLTQLIRTVAGARSNTERGPIVVDPQNDVYFSTQDGTVVEYSEGAETLIRTLPVSADSLAVDRSSNVYVGAAAIEVYGPTGASPVRTIPAAYADALAVDSIGHIYAAVCPQGKGAIDVFSPTGTLIRQKPGCSFFLALDGNDRLYAGYEGAYRDLNGAVAVYKPYGFKTFKVIHQGIHRIRAMIVDPAGDLYVANGRGGTGTGDVVMYPAGKGVPAWRVDGGARNGVTYPQGLALWNLR